MSFRSDLSKYELNSTGEYTQGAGAIALLISENPSILSIDNVWGVATKSENDFFKPRRTFDKKELVSEIIGKLDLNISNIESTVFKFIERYMAFFEYYSLGFVDFNSMLSYQENSTMIKA